MSGGYLVAMFVLLAVGASVIALAQWRQRSRDTVLLNHWDALCACRDTTPSSVVIEVVQVYQRAQRGTKAVVVVDGIGQRHDAWFHGIAVRPAPSSLWLVLPHTGWGPHNQNPVLYLNPDQLLATAPPGTREAVQRRHTGRQRTR